MTKKKPNAGKSGAKADKVWAGAISRAVHRFHEETDEDGKVKKQRFLSVLADRIVESAADGDIAALKEIGDRLDGKPVQGVELGGKDGSPVTFIMNVEK